MAELSLPEQFIGFAASCEHDGGTTYAAICRGVAESPEIIDLIAQAPEAQRRPNLLLAAVHYLLLSGTPHPLAAHYDSVASWLKQSDPPTPTNDVVTDFTDFCLEHRDELIGLIASRSTQTNEVGRCTGLLPALHHIAALASPIHQLSLLDLGTSAGLNLLFDRYHYSYHSRSDRTPLEAGPADSPVQLDCNVGGDLYNLPGLTAPTIVQRAGLDLSPIDPTSEDGALWLLACQWPDNLARFSRVSGAIEVARAESEPPRLHQGDVVDDVARVVATFSPDVPLVVFHSWVAAYLTKEKQRDLVSVIRELQDRRPLHYLYAEAPFETRGLPTPPPPQPTETADLATALVYIAPNAEPKRLADMHPHGRSVRWWPA
jgi:hypothetical protein